MRAWRMPHDDHRHELEDARDEIDDPQAAHGAPDEVIEEDRLQHRPRLPEIVLLPEYRPGQHDEQESDLHKERDEDEPTDQLR